MQRRILAVVLVLALLLAGAAVLVATRVEVASRTTPALASSASSGASRTGVRVRIAALEDGRPLANVRVHAFIPRSDPAWRSVDRWRGGPGESPRTGADGIAELELSAGHDYVIDTLAPHDAANSRSVRLDPPLAAGEVRELAIALATRPDLVLHGRVVDRETAAPIAGARVTPTAGMTSVDAWTADADGRFVAPIKSWHRPLLTVTAAGYEVAKVVPDKGWDTRERALEIAIARVASARITVLDAAGAPIAGVEATLDTDEHRFGRPDGRALIDWHQTGKVTYRARTDASGTAVFDALPPRMPLAGRLQRERREPFRAPEALTLAPGETRAVTWRAGSGCTIRGVALELDGAPASALAVCLEPARFARPVYLDTTASPERRFASTDAEGRFTFDDVGAGDWWLGAAPAKLARGRTIHPRDAAGRARVVRVAPDVPHVDVEIRAHRGLLIAGRVLDPSGAPVSVARIEFARASEDLRGIETMYDDAGRFLLGPLEAGEYELRARPAGRFAVSERVVARAGDADVVLRLEAGGALEGLVVEKATGAPSAARVVESARELGDDGTSFPRVVANGTLRLDGLAPGVYDLAASTPNGLVAVARGIEVEVGATRHVQLELVPGARVRVRFEGPGPVAGVMVLAGGALVATDDVEKGTEATLLSPAGAVVVRLRDQAGSKDFDLPLELRAGEARDLVFDGAWR